MRKSCVWVGAVAAALVSAAAWADVVNLAPSKDATLIEDPQGDLANGLGEAFHVGKTNQNSPGNDRRRGIVAFNLSSIPAGSTVTAVSLTLNMSGNNAGAQNVTLHKVLADWGEGTTTGASGGGQGAPATTNSVTWLHRFYSGTTWSTAGGQFTAGASATLSVGGTGSYVWNSAGMVTDVQGWLNNSATNFGWILRGNETTAGTAKRFDSGENASSAVRPKLTVTFTPPTGACCINGVCSIVSQASCTSSGGTYQGNATVCSPNPCPQPTGACCLPGDVCNVLTQADCTTAGGTYQGHNTTCSPSPCYPIVEVTLSPLQDTSIYENAQNNGNGAGEFIVTGTTGSLLTDILSRVGLVKFDLTSVPSNATILDATLTMRLLETTDTAALNVAIHRLTQAWGEAGSNGATDEYSGAAAQTGDATWLRSFHPSTSWTTPGGRFISTASATTSVGIVANVYSDWTGAGVLADVQQWVQTPSTNHGWTVISGALSGSHLRGFGSSDNSLARNRPVLTLHYQVLPATGACCFADGSCQELTAAGCALQGGTYSGDNTTCTPNLCPQPTGACCLPSGNCAVLTAADCATQGGTYNGDNSPCAGQDCPIVLTPFVDALPIPGVMTPTTGTAGGAAHYDINIVEVQQQLHSQLPPTTVWTYNGLYPAATIEATRGLPVTVSYFNDLRDTSQVGQPLRTQHYFPVDTCLHGPDTTGQVPVTVTHLHGAKVEPESDGDPDTAFPPGTGAPLYTYPNDQAACTMWYHDHALGITRLNVYMGLAGFYLLRDAASNALNLPQGHNDIPLVIQDRSFNPDGSWKYHADLQQDFFGEFTLVNGKVWPYLDVRRGKYRFRLLNGSNSRTYTLSLSDGSTFWQIGTDLGLRSAPLAVTSITLSPAERVEIIVDFQPYGAGRVLELVNSAVAPFPNGPPESVTPTVMQFRVTATAGDTDPVPLALVPVTPPLTNANTLEREFELRNFADVQCPGHPDGTWMINGLMWDDLTEFPREGATEIWSWINRSAFVHPMHIHLVRFQVLNRQAFNIVSGDVVPSGPLIPPDPSEQGWKDTVRATPNQITRVAARFEGFTGIFPYHCHILEHEDHEMMRRFQVVCVADFDDGSGTGQPDGGITIDDLLYYINLFDMGDPSADVDDGTGTATPDGGVTIDDLIFYLERFDAGC